MMKRARTAPITAPATATEEVCLNGTSVKQQKLGLSNNFKKFLNLHTLISKMFKD